MDGYEFSLLNLADDELYRTLGKIQKLKRLPWIGKNYYESRILILGDSHYALNEAAEQEFKDPYSTIETIKSVIQTGPYSFYRGLYDLFHIETKREIDNFWSNIAFYNFVQEVMKSVHEKPSPIHRMEAWQCLAEVVKVLHPKFILFLGIRNWYGTHALEKTDVSCELIWDTTKISRTKPAYGKLTTPQEVIPFSIIRHSAMGFNVPLWREYLQKKVPTIMSCLQS